MRAATVIFLLTCGAAASAEPAHEALTLPAGKAHEACLVMQAGDRLDYTYSADVPLAFNLHYHSEGTVMFPVAEHDAAAENGTFLAPVRQHYCLMWTNDGTAPVGLRIDYTHTPAL